MSDESRTDLILDAIIHYKADLRLGDWDIDYTEDNGKLHKDSVAQTDIRNHQRCVTIRIDPEVPDDQIDRVICHELVHLVLLDLTDVYNHALSKAGAAGLGVMDLMADMMERVCERIAEAMTHTPWEPVGKSNRAKHPGYIRNHIVSHQTQEVS